MNPLIVLSAVLAAASAAPSGVALAGAPALAHGYVAGGVNVPAPYTTSRVTGPAVETVHQAPAQVRKEVHFGQTQFVSGYAARIHKPATPFLPIAVPTALKGSVATNPAIVNTVKEEYQVNEPYAVERRVEVPYDVPVVKEQIVEVPVPYHVDKPYAVPHAVPVRGEPIVNVRRGPAIVQRTHSAVAALPAAAVGYTGAAVVGTPAVGIAGAAAIPAAVGYTGVAGAALPAVGYTGAAIPTIGYAGAAIPAVGAAIPVAEAAAVAKDY